MFEVWDRVTGRCLGTYETEEEAEGHIPTTFAQDFIILEADELPPAA